ncbi:MAG: hypothetical protein DI605_18190 [Sphingomonas sp.]|nr:MAG: hypothetical protein DI605_18190 [Sphingomonas sp.]
MRHRAVIRYGLQVGMQQGRIVIPTAVVPGVVDRSQDALDQQFRRAVFNIVGRNQDDHVKNIAFLMDPTGAWRLAPAFDIAYAYNPAGDWTSRHQMSLAGLRDDFTLESLIEGGRSAGVSARTVRSMVSEVSDAIGQWRAIATDVEVPPDFIDDIEAHLRLDIR